jgi:hypothetical protein
MGYRGFQSLVAFAKGGANRARQMTENLNRNLAMSRHRTGQPTLRTATPKRHRRGDAEARLMLQKRSGLPYPQD